MNANHRYCCVVVVVGFERAVYTAGEGDGAVEVCVVLDDAGDFQPGSIILNVVAVAGSAEGELASL